MSILQQVTIRTAIDTVCPNGGIDENEIAVSWTPRPFRTLIDAEDVHRLVAKLRGEEIYCENLALLLAKQLQDLTDYAVTVVVRQASGHGVEATATSP
jgi:hypothetical protein